MVSRPLEHFPAVLEIIFSTNIRVRTIFILIHENNSVLESFHVADDNAQCLFGQMRVNLVAMTLTRYPGQLEQLGFCSEQNSCKCHHIKMCFLLIVSGATQKRERTTPCFCRVASKTCFSSSCGDAASGSGEQLVFRADAE